MPGGKIPETYVADFEVAYDLADREDIVRNIVGSDLECGDTIVRTVVNFLHEAEQLFATCDYSVERGIAQTCLLGNFVAAISLQTSSINNREILIDCLLALNEFKNLNFLDNTLIHGFSIAKQQILIIDAAEGKRLMYNTKTALGSAVNIFRHYGLTLEKEL